MENQCAYWLVDLMLNAIIAGHPYGRLGLWQAGYGRLLVGTDISLDKLSAQILNYFLTELSSGLESGPNPGLCLCWTFIWWIRNQLSRERCSIKQDDLRSGKVLNSNMKKTLVLYAPDLRPLLGLCVF